VTFLARGRLHSPQCRVHSLVCNGREPSDFLIVHAASPGRRDVTCPVYCAPSREGRFPNDIGDTQPKSPAQQSEPAHPGAVRRRWRGFRLAVGSESGLPSSASPLGERGKRPKRGFYVDYPCRGHAFVLSNWHHDRTDELRRSSMKKVRIPAIVNSQIAPW
jgi:hypothetical protein